MIEFLIFCAWFSGYMLVASITGALFYRKCSDGTNYANPGVPAGIFGGIAWPVGIWAAIAWSIVAMLDARDHRKAEAARQQEIENKRLKEILKKEGLEALIDG